MGEKNYKQKARKKEKIKWTRGPRLYCTLKLFSLKQNISHAWAFSIMHCNSCQKFNTFIKNKLNTKLNKQHLWKQYIIQHLNNKQIIVFYFFKRLKNILKKIHFRTKQIGKFFREFSQTNKCRSTNIVTQFWIIWNFD